MTQCSFCGRSSAVVSHITQNAPATAHICNECIAVLHTVEHGRDVPKVAPKPCDAPCPKCGSVDIYRRFWAQGVTFRDDTLNDRPSTPFVDRSNGTLHLQTALQDCIVNHCRHCQFSWDSAPLGTPS